MPKWARSGRRTPYRAAMPIAPRSPATRGAREGWVSTFALVAIVGLAAFVVRIGADSLWLVALGDHIRATGSIPRGIPFAAAPTDDWHNPNVVAELLFSLIHDIGPAALPVFQMSVVTVTLLVVAASARWRGASDPAIAGVLVVVMFGALPALLVVRLQTLSLIPFVLLLQLLRSEHRRQTRAIYAAPVLVAIWTNLHGAVLVGVAITGVYLLVSRMRQRPWETVGVGCLTLVALLATPAGWRTAQYFASAVDNEAARQGTGLWARPTLDNPFDLLLALAAVVLVVLAVRSKPPLWEGLVMAALCVGTVLASRHGIWLLLAAAPSASLGLSVAQDRVAAVRWGRDVAAWAVATIAALVVVLDRGAATEPASPLVVAAIQDRTSGQVVAAPAEMAEPLAVAGATVWISNPIDAFSHEDQRSYLRFIDEGDVSVAARHADAVVVLRDSRLDAAMQRQPSFEVTGDYDPWVLYQRR
jgi:hypothetical protein